MVERIAGVALIVAMLYAFILYVTIQDNRGTPRAWYRWAWAGARNTLGVLGFLAIWGGATGGLVLACMLLTGEIKW